MFERCILHIGTEKTGTTSIQAMLNGSQAELHKLGFHYPLRFGYGGQRSLATYSMEDEDTDDSKRAFELDGSGKLEAFRRKIEGDMADITHGFSSKYQTLLLSSEHFHSRLRTGKSVLRLRNLLTRHCKSFKVIVYMRPQHELAVSIYSTRLRVGVVDPELIPIGSTPVHYYNYKSLLDRWVSVFGRENICPRIYSSNVTKDFLRQCGIGDDALHEPRRRNESLSREAQIFLNEINRHLTSGRGDIVSFVEKIGNSPALKPTKRQVEAFMKIYAEGNEAVRSEWFPERQNLFDVDLSKFPDEAQDISLGRADVFRIFAQIWAAKVESAEGAKK